MGAYAFIATWRDEYHPNNWGEAEEPPYPCPWCGCEVIFYMSGWDNGTGVTSDTWHQYVHCMLCGWSWSIRDHKHFGGEHRVKRLKKFGINSLKVGLHELGTHLKIHADQLQLLDWKRFEDLTNAVFREHGFETIQTARAKDGGADILLIGAGGQVSGIVECKRRKRDNAIGISTVRSLMGAAILWETREAFLVTSGTFTSYSRRSVLDYREKGYALNLVDATEFLRYLDVYNEQMPALNKLSKAKRKDIIDANMKVFEAIPVRELDVL